MKAMIVPEFGGPEVLRFSEVPDPAPGAHDLLLEVRCAGLNPVDTEDVVDAVARQTNGRGCDVVFDCVGLAVMDQSMRCVAPLGRMATIVGAKSTDSLRELFIRSATLHCEFMGATTMYGLRLEHQGEILRSLADLVDRGKLRVHVSSTFELADLAAAHRLQETARVIGKIVVQVA